MPRVLPLLLCGVFAAGAAHAGCSVRSDHLLPVLELYTSEGCSSCPPADRWMSKLIEKPIAAVPLAFHVDYWDELGWKDRFASRAFSERQSRRVSAAGGKTVYTPQVMLGPDVQVDWQKRSALSAAAKRQVLSPAGLHVTLSAQREGEDLKVHFYAQGLPAGEWQFELVSYRDDQDSVVTAGENKRLALHHDRVAGTAHGPWTINIVGMPRGRLAKEADASGLVAVLQRRDAAGTGWALDLPLGSCADEAEAPL